MEKLPNEILDLIIQKTFKYDKNVEIFLNLTETNKKFYNLTRRYYDLIFQYYCTQKYHVLYLMGYTLHNNCFKIKNFLNKKYWNYYYGCSNHHDIYQIGSGCNITDGCILYIEECIIFNFNNQITMKFKEPKTWTLKPIITDNNHYCSEGNCEVRFKK